MNNSIEFKLFAPYNEGATLMGSFSEWKEIPMKKGDDGYFRTSVLLDDGGYQYKFRVQSLSWFVEPNEWVDVIDPCATDIDNSSQNAIIIIKDGDRIVDDYIWKHDDKNLPSDRELVIYELHVGDFSGGEKDNKIRGKYQDIIEKIDYLCELGINAIELMPVNEYPGDHSWGYNPRHFFATESSYGSTSDLKQLIDSCHEKGIRVILDVIYNHSESEAPLTKINYDYWYHHSPRDPDNNWGPEFNYDLYDENLQIHPAWEFVGDNLIFWIKEYHIDGIRLDAARQIDNYDFMHWIVGQGKQTAGIKPFFTIAEHIPETTTITNAEGPMDSCWHESFYNTIMTHICGDGFDLESLKDVIDCKRQGFMGESNVVNYLTNHDHNHLMAELSDRNIFYEEAFKRIKLGVAILMTAIGIPMIWMGEELGEYKYKKMESSKIDWQLLENDLNKNLLEYYKGLISLRKNNRALWTENIDFFHENNEAGILAYTRWNEEGSRIVIIVNFSDTFRAGYHIPNFPANGKWHEWTGNYEMESGDNGMTIDLGTYEAKVLVWQ
ncbi:alpha-amylase family glycosyl hydrolase [Geminocystis sp. NIES-3709]|uniref:alpha-amylase family glycosyl hydrolase n=1 Tax=Geminocystis sp. NIES-3709 TaxID=1617448 RepID=UPI0005FC5283|nr:alpha-amylase family glycosyl hydrolase [Geminocystis sp. NIES-3709]BAQ65350.1 1,4-alpha-glucan branching enzyme [Geminocystis sp. NIES-3709]